MNFNHEEKHYDIVYNIWDLSNGLNSVLFLSKLCRKATVPGNKPSDLNECS